MHMYMYIYMETWLYGPNQHTNVTVKYENQILEQLSSAKLLGIHIDTNLTWQDKYNYICKKISQKNWRLKTNQRLCEH